MIYEIVTRDEDGVEWSFLKGTGTSILKILGFEDDLDNTGFEVKIESEGQVYVLKGKE